MKTMLRKKYRISKKSNRRIKSKKKCESRNSKILIHDWIQISIFISLVVAAIISICQYKQQRIYNKESLRPWIYASLQKSKILKDDNANYEKIIGVEHNITCKNTGNKPALDVIIRYWFNGRKDFNINQIIESDSLFFRNESFNKDERGWAIFPNDSSRSNIEIPFATALEATSNNKQEISYYFATLITYKDNSGESYKTKQIYKVELKGPFYPKPGALLWVINPSEKLYTFAD